MERYKGKTLEEQYEFQNRKRYGGMHDSRRTTSKDRVPLEGFKTVNGMEACTTMERLCWSSWCDSNVSKP